MGLIVVAAFLLLFMAGFPVAYAILLPSIGYVLAEGLPWGLLAQRITYALDSFPLVAVPIFIFVGNLMNSAGITDRGTIWDTDPQLFDQMFAVNVRAPFFLMQDALKVMKREKIEGSIVNIISMSGHGGQSFITAYCSSKGALITLTKNVAYSVLNHRIRVNGLTIGHMDTPGEDRIMKTYHGAQEGWIEDAKKQKPFGRLLDTAEVSRAVAYLSSAESGMMTGSIIDFDQQVAGTGDSPPIPPAA